MPKEKELHTSVEVDFEVDENFDSESFIKLNLRLMHDGENPKGLNFTTESLENALESIKNKPILGRVIFDDDNQPQFSSHDRHIEEDYNGDIRIIYDEIPIGLIPESSKLEIKKEFNRTYCYAEAYIWKKYSNYARDIIERDKDIKLSVEVKIMNYTKDDKGQLDEVTEYVFDGVTLLGNNRGTGMKNAKATAEEEFSIDTKKEYMVELMNELKECIENFSNEKLTEGGNKDLETKDKEKGIQNPANPENEFELTVNEQREKIVEALRIKFKDFDGYVYLFDFDSKYAYFTKEQYIDKIWKANKYRIGYTYGDEGVSFADDETEVIVKLLTKDEWDKLEQERETFNVQFEELKKFKEDTIADKRKADVKAIFDKFDAKLKDVEAYQTLKDKNAEFDLEQIEEKCFALVGRLGLSSIKTDESKEENFDDTKDTKDDEPQVIKTNIEEEFDDEEQKSSYLNGILDDYYN